MTALRIALDARLISGKQGGVEQFIIGMAKGLSTLTDGDEEYLFLSHEGDDQWLRPHLGGACRLLSVTPPAGEGWKKKIVARAPFVMHAWHEARALLGQRAVGVPRSDGTIERAGIDVMHFTLQGGFLTEIPSIYHPHDLQHLHLPQFLSRFEQVKREMRYKAFLGQANTVAVVSSWVKQDVIRHYGLSPDKIQVVPLAPSIEAYPVPTADDLHRVRQVYRLPEAFAFYPAQTWPHKNHAALLEALTILRARHGLTVPLVCSGRLTDHYAKLRRLIRQSGLDNQVWFLDFVSPLELQALYRLCRCVVIPTLFEAASFPLWEAFLASVPTACSNVTSLPDQAGDSALVFDPAHPEEMADTIAQLWNDADLRVQLAERGRRNVGRFNWERTARTFRALYRRVGGRNLSPQDHALLNDAPLL